MNKTSTNSQRYDKRAIKEFLMHAAGELRLQEFALQGKPVPPKLQQGVTERGSSASYMSRSLA